MLAILEILYMMPIARKVVDVINQGPKAMKKNWSDTVAQVAGSRYFERERLFSLEDLGDSSAELLRGELAIPVLVKDVERLSRLVQGKHRLEVFCCKVVTAGRLQVPVYVERHTLGLLLRSCLEPLL